MLLGKEPGHRDINGNGGSERCRRLQRRHHPDCHAVRAGAVAPAQFVVTHRQFPKLRPAILVKFALSYGRSVVIHRPPRWGSAGWSLDHDLLTGKKDIARMAGQRMRDDAGVCLTIGSEPRAHKNAQDSGQYPYSSHHAATPKRHGAAL